MKNSLLIAAMIATVLGSCSDSDREYEWTEVQVPSDTFTMTKTTTTNEDKTGILYQERELLVDQWGAVGPVGIPIYKPDLTQFESPVEITKDTIVISDDKYNVRTVTITYTNRYIVFDNEEEAKAAVVVTNVDENNFITDDTHKYVMFSKNLSFLIRDGGTFNCSFKLYGDILVETVIEEYDRVYYTNYI